MDDAVKLREKIFSCFYLNREFSGNLPENEKKELAEKHLKEIFASAGVDYEKPDIEGLYYAVDLLASRSLIEGGDRKDIISSLKCFNESSEL